MDVVTKSSKVKKRSVREPRVRWCNLNRENIDKLSEKIIKNYNRRYMEASKRCRQMWEPIAECIRRVAQEVLGISNGGCGRREGACWWNEEVQEKVKEKQKAYAALIDRTMEEKKDIHKIKYRDAKKLAKKVVNIDKNNAFRRLYQKLETKEGEKDVFRLAKATEKKTKDLRIIRCIKGDDRKALIEETIIRER